MDSEFLPNCRMNLSDLWEGQSAGSAWEKWWKNFWDWCSLKMPASRQCPQNTNPRVTCYKALVALEDKEKDQNVPASHDGGNGSVKEKMGIIFPLIRGKKKSGSDSLILLHVGAPNSYTFSCQTCLS